MRAQESTGMSSGEGQATNVAVTAKSLGVKAFVNLAQMTLSQMSETETTGSPEQKQEWLAEQMLRWSGLVRFENDPRIAHPSQGGPVTRGVLMSVKSVGAIVIRY